MLPDFLVVGAAKAGTTSLHNYLSQHPQIATTSPKETFFFVGEEVDPCRGVGWWYAPRPILRDIEEYSCLFAKTGPRIVSGESCVAYLYFPKAAARIRAANPNCKLIVVLRNPAERAFSNYQHTLRDNLEPLSFRKALDAAEQRLREGWWFGFDHIGNSRYGVKVQNIYEHFPADQVRILWYDDLCRDPVAFCRDIFTYIGVDPYFRIDAFNKLLVGQIERRWVRHRMLAMTAPFRPVARRVLSTSVRNSIGRRIKKARYFRPELSAEDARRVIEVLVMTLSSSNS